MSSCPDCGSRTPRNGRCKQCAIIDRHDDTTHDEYVPTVNTYVCTECGERYQTDGSDGCPSCGSRRRRYDGELMADGGQQRGDIETLSDLAEYLEQSAETLPDSEHSEGVAIGYRNAAGVVRGFRDDLGADVEELREEAREITTHINDLQATREMLADDGNEQAGDGGGS